VLTNVFSFQADSGNSLHSQWRSRKSPIRRRRTVRRLLAELLEPRCLLSAETGSSLLFSGIAPSPISSTNSGLLIAADVGSGLAAPLHAPFSSIEDRANGWRLPLNAGFSGLAFGPAAQQLFGAASSGPQSASNLLTMDPYTGVQKAAPVPIRAAAQALHISDLATVPGGYYQLYGLGRPVATPSASFQLFVIDPGSGQAMAIADQPTWLASLSSADALAFGPDGTLYVGGQEKVGNAAVLYVQQPNGDDPLVTRHALTDSVLGMDARVVGSESQGAQVEVLTVVAGGQLRWLDPASGQFTGTVALSDPVRGIAGDIAFHPAPDSLTLQQVHHADFETGANGYTADNAIEVMPGMWHHSPGRWDDKLINHTHGQRKMPGFNWYYGQFETSLGGGTYLTNYHHAGILASPLISVPECATTTLSFSYLLDVRPPLDVDFVEVWAQFTDQAGQVQRTRLMSRAEGTLPQTGNRWLTATADLSPFAGHEVQIQFLFDTGNVPDVDPEGWYVDDVLVASMPKAICGYKFHDLDSDRRWDPGEPGLNDRRIYVDLDGNGRYDPAVPARTFAGGLDANTFASGHRVVHPDGQAVLEVSATGEPIWATPDPFQPSRKVLAWGTAAGEEVWPVGPMLRATFATAVHTVALDVARADAAAGSTRVVLQAFDQHGNRIAEQVRTLADAQWQTLTVSVTSGEIASVKASVDQGAARFNDLRYWGTTPSVEGEPSFVTRNNGQYNGAFWFDRLPPGEHTLREELPENWWRQSYPGSPDFAHTVIVTAGHAVQGRWEHTEAPNFGNWLSASASGLKFEDQNADGQPREQGEPGLPEWIIYVDYNDNNILDEDEPHAVTTDDGSYLIEGIRPGTWKVREEAREGWINSYPSDGYYEATFVARQTVTGLDFGNWTWARIESSFKFEDLDADGEPREDTEPGLSGWTVFVDYNGNGILDTDEPSGVTGVDGRYTIERIRPGTWQVREVPQDGWTNSYPAGGSDEQKFESGQTVTGLDFGNWTWARIESSFKFEDLDADGQPREDGEPGLSGWTVFVDYNDNGLLDSDEPSEVTDEDGQYTITGIRPGTWRVREVPQDGWTNSYPPGGSYEQKFESRQTVTGLDFRNWTWTSISGEKYQVDNQGTRGAGLPGWTIYVDYNDNATLDPGEPFAVSGVDGSYTIQEIKPGTYKVREVSQNGWKISQPPQGFHELNLRSRQHVPDVDFGNREEVLGIPTQVVQFITPMSFYRPNGPSQPPPETGPTSIQGYVWQDLNQNGKRDEGEVGAGGWSVILTNTTDGTQEITVTATDGRYVFDPTPGVYSIRFDRFGMSDGTFELITLPDTGEYVVEVSADGPEGITVTPSENLDFGIFVYSPFTRPADNHYGRIEEPTYQRRDWLLAALELWQSFTVTNTTASPMEITEIKKNIDTSRIPVADQFVTVFLKQGGTLLPILDLEPGADSSVIRVDPPISAPSGETLQFFAFYDPAIRDQDRVVEQYPDWYGANRHARPAHTFTRDDHLTVMTNTDAAFRVDLVGGSTYDSDIFYDGAVDLEDFRHLDDLLRQKTIERKLFIPFDDPLFDPTADNNSRCANEADGVQASCAWPLLGFPTRELGLGDFGPMNVEWNRARAPFLDLDPDDSSGVKGVDFRNEYQGEPVEIADRDAAFANSIERDLVSLVAEIRGEANGDRLYVDEAILAARGITADGTNGTSRLELAGTASVDDYTAALREIKFQSDSLASRTVEIEIRAIGSGLGAPGSMFTDVEGNLALSRIIVTTVEDSNITGLTDFDAAVVAEPEWAGESQTSYTHVPAAMAVAAINASDGASSANSIQSNGWQNAENRYDVSGDRVVTSLDVLLIVNYLDANPAGTELPSEPRMRHPIWTSTKTVTAPHLTRYW
jgi:hypothetical protein